MNRDNKYSSKVREFLLWSGIFKNMIVAKISDMINEMKEQDKK